MENEIRFTGDSKQDLMAFSMSETLTSISKRETWYSKAIANRNNVSPHFVYDHAMLLMAQRSLVTELTDMGFLDLAYLSVDIGVKQASETKRK